MYTVHTHTHTYYVPTHIPYVYPCPYSLQYIPLLHTIYHIPTYTYPYHMHHILHTPLYIHTLIYPMVIYAPPYIHSPLYVLPYTQTLAIYPCYIYTSHLLPTVICILII